MSIRRQSLGAIVVAFMAVPLLKAQPVHTWVAGTGSDANPCTVTQPCATFARAFAATAAGGMISVLSPGDFGGVTISHAITIDGGAVGGTITFTTLGTAAINVTAGTSDTVILRHLAVNGINKGDFGIGLFTARQVIIEDCDVEGFNSNNGSVGLFIGSQNTPIDVIVQNTRIVGNTTGVEVYPSANGMPNTFMSLRHVVISSIYWGLVSENGTLEISDSLITQNQSALSTGGNPFVNVANSVISYNTVEESPNGGVIILANNNIFFGNGGSLGPPGGPATVSSPEQSTHGRMPVRAAPTGHQQP